MDAPIGSVLVVNTKRELTEAEWDALMERNEIMTVEYYPLTQNTSGLLGRFATNIDLVDSYSDSSYNEMRDWLAEEIIKLVGGSHMEDQPMYMRS